MMGHKKGAWKIGDPDQLRVITGLSRDQNKICSPKLQPIPNLLPGRFHIM